MAEAYLLFCVSAVSFWRMKCHYEYLEISAEFRRLKDGLSDEALIEFLRYRNIFLTGKRIFTNWLVVMLAVTLFLSGFSPAAIFIILFFYVYILFLAPQLLYQFRH